MDYEIEFEEELRLPAASSVKGIRVDTAIPIALHIQTSSVFYNVSALGHRQVRRTMIALFFLLVDGQVPKSQYITSTTSLGYSAVLVCG